jgi:AraC family transcriptional regulator of adaptative response/methylated-DNA-[protein]-cysteine methyltransferase
LRARRLGHALGRLQVGDALSEAAYDHGFDSESGFRDAFARWCGDAPGRRRNGALVLVTRVLTPLGPMVAGATDRGVCLLEFAERRRLETQVKRIQARLGCAVAPGEHPLLAQVQSELQRYFAGELRAFSVPLLMLGTEFQRAVWQELGNVPYGVTRSYDELARALGRVGAQRAVGRANGENPLAIVVPCHRIVRADGTLCGYGGGVWRKRWLLELEQRATAKNV